MKKNCRIFGFKCPLHNSKFHLSILYNFYRKILYLYKIVIPIKFSNICNLKKAGMASCNIVMKKQYTLFWSALQYSSDFSFLVLNILAD